MPSLTKLYEKWQSYRCHDMGDIDESIYNDLRKTIVQMRHKRAGETKMMARYGTFVCIVNVLKRQILTI